MNVANHKRQVLARIVGLADGQEIVSAKLLETECEAPCTSSNCGSFGSTPFCEGTEELEQYLEGLGEQVNKLHIAMMRQDLLQLEELVEDIKRGAGSYGLRRITAMADRLDAELETDSDDDLCGLVNQVSALSEVCREMLCGDEQGGDDYLPGA
ncbi:hypothetical protein JD969_11755 [Planctomycetota bacterium]|nr:hypothetical protein JD969_11755 [Planctomycetota bacterium]